MDMLTLAAAKKYTNSQRLGYVEVNRDVIAPSTTMTFAQNEDENVWNSTENLKTSLRYKTTDKFLAAFQADPSSYLPRALTITWGGTDYLCPLQMLDGQPCYGAVWKFLDLLGAPEEEKAELGVVESYEPFLASVTADFETIDGSLHLVIHLSFGAFAEIATQTVQVSICEETIHTIDPKYLPGVCLPVVELSTIYPADGSIVELTADECSKLYAAAIGSNYVIVRLQYATANFPLGVLFTVCVEGEAYVFVAAFGTELLIISTDGESGQLGG